MTAAPLSTIIALARAGALDHAWGQFSASGYDRNDDDPAALTVKGRLLKDHALRASDEETRRRYYLQSAEAYRRSAALQPGTYPLINAASLSLLSGDRGQAEEIAREVLARIEREPDEPETPYYRAATQAEALLLLGRTGEARAALEAAVAAAPRAWEDHGSTLRQFVVIHDMLGSDPAWLDLLRPPRSLHYSGHVAFDADAAFDEALAAVLDEERIGFGYGALGAGADLVVAEALLARGADLHVILPSDAASFAARFVDPFGAGWRARFDAALDAAETIEHVRPLQTPPDARMVALAEEVALGAAMLNAERLMSEAVALRVGPGSAGSALRTHRLDAPTGAAPIEAAAGPDSRSVPLALLAVSVGGGGEEGFEDRLEDVQEVLALAGEARIAPHLGGDSILIGYEDPARAAAAARTIHARLRARMPLRVAGHYGLLPCVRDPFTAALRPTEAGAAIVRAIAGAIPPDTICVSQDFAAVLAAGASAPGDANLIGELQAIDGGSPISLYALKPAAFS
jgi:tetratricopeptide (TPR) repeat protein